MTKNEARQLQGRGRGSWSCPLLLKRLFYVLVADKANLLLLIGQPVLIGLLLSFVVTRDSSITKKLFLGNIAVMWMACSSAAQIIVRERTIVFRERLAGLRLNAYVMSKFLGMGGIAVAQAAILLLILKFAGNGLIGNWGWQFVAFAGSALALTGIGVVISAMCKAPTQAAMAVTLFIIPQILLAGYVYPLEEWKKQPVAAFLAWLSPSHAAQRLVDVSLLWDREIDSGELSKLSLNLHLENLQNASVPWSVWFAKEPVDSEIPALVAAQIYKADGRPMEEERAISYSWPISSPKFERGRTYQHYGAAVQPLALLGGWVVVSYIASGLILKRSRAQ